MEKIPDNILNDAGSVHPAENFYSRYGKRLLDVLFSGLAIVVLSPVLLVVSLLELVIHGRPVMYHTLRPGKDGKPFKMYKFRSMTNAKDAEGNLLPDKDRLTKFGKFLRKTSIDELPGLFSVFTGKMSIIGPRPLLMEYIPYYSPRHRMRHCVRPGLTCVRINPQPGDTWTWADQFENDIWYIENLSFKTDLRELKAIIRTVFAAEEYRTNAERVPFLGGETLYELKSNTETGLDKMVFASTDMNEDKK